MIDNWEDVRRAHDADDLAFGTVESWIAYVSLELSLYPSAIVVK
jgi:glycerol kinase